MAKLEYGVSSPDVKKLQQDINKIMGKGTVPEDGTFDESTRDKLAELQKKMGKMQTGTADKQTLADIKDAKVDRKLVTINSQSAYVTKAQLATLQSKANANAAAAVQGYVDMANHAKSTWDRHFKTRDANWFWSGVVDVAAGISFPKKGVIDKAVGAATAMKTAAAAGTLKKESLGSQSAPIRTAFAAMDQYEDELFGGGAGLIGQLQNIQTACVTVLQVSAAVATGGASWQVQVGVAAGMGAYEAVLGEIDKAPTDHKQSASSVAKAVFKGAAVDGGIALVMKGGGKGLGNFGDDVVKEAVKESAKGGSKALLKEYGKRALNGGGQKLIEGRHQDPRQSRPTRRTEGWQGIRDGRGHELRQGGGIRRPRTGGGQVRQGRQQALQPGRFQGAGQGQTRRCARRRRQVRARQGGHRRGQEDAGHLDAQEESLELREGSQDVRAEGPRRERLGEQGRKEEKEVDG